MKRLPRILLALCVGALGLPLVLQVNSSAMPGASLQPSPSPTTEPDWSQELPYYYQGEFRVLSNEKTFGGMGFTGYTPLSNGQTDAKLEERTGVNLRALWTKKCEPVDEQTIKLSRKILLPGDPDKLQASVFLYGPVKNPVNLITLKINGATLHQERAAAGDPLANDVTRTLVDLPASARQLFRYGENTLTIVAHKKPTKKKANVCNPADRFGVAMELWGEFSGDVSATVPPGTVFGGLSEGNGVAPMTMTVTNHGPSDVPAHSAGAHLYALSEQATINFVKACEGPNTCSETRPDCSSSGYFIGGRTGFMTTCPLPHLAPSDTINLYFLVGFSNWAPGEKIFFGYGGGGFFENLDTIENNGEDNREIKEVNPSPTPPP